MMAGAGFIRNSSNTRAITKDDRSIGAFCFACELLHKLLKEIAVPDRQKDLTMHGSRQPHSRSIAIELNERLSSSHPDDASGLLDIEQKSRTKPATRLQRILALWPWAWLAFASAITLAWAIALCWAAFALVRWLVD
jgi:hypothetical protein